MTVPSSQNKKKHSSTAIRPEIQGLRAIAVLAVLLFHIWPSSLPGGYVGVDVFFVISGYLITGLLLREAEQTGHISLGNFYTRRIYRLLPAATLVIVVSTLCFQQLPEVQWINTAHDAVASALYVQNWWQAAQAIDYLAEDNAPGFLLHYWSLSVEEQYYIVWPLLAWFAISFSTTVRANPRKRFLAITAVFGIVSFFYSIYLTHHNPALAYFATTTRAWELAIGGLLAISGPFFGRLPAILRAILGWLGLGMIFLAYLIFGSRTPFPGYAALIPTIGAGLVIISARTLHAWSSYRLLRIPPLQFVGNISYSLYLWHWPVLILYRNIVTGNTIPWFDGIGIAIIAIFLAWITKQWVEDPIRYRTPSQKGWSISSLVILTISICLVLAISGIVRLFAGNKAGAPITKVDPQLLEQPYNPQLPTVPSVENARNDNPDVYRLKCHVDQISSEPKSCSFGPASASHTVVLVGDSHAAQWLPALRAIYGDLPDYRIVTFTKSACAFNAQTVTIGKDQRRYESCTKWNENVLSKLDALKPEIIFTSAASGYRIDRLEDERKNLPLLAEGLIFRWKQLLSISPKVIVIRDTPKMEMNIPECMSRKDVSVTDCSTPRKIALRQDPSVLAMQQFPKNLQGLTYMDMTDQICEKNLCRPVKGQILVWRDSHHLTATFSRLLAPQIQRHIDNQ